MLLHIPEVLNSEEVAACRRLLDVSPDWRDGRVTAGLQSALVKHNAQLAEGSEAARQCGEIILGALGRNLLFLSAVLPKQVFPPLFNRYAGGQSFGSHVDNAIRQIPQTGERIRTDVSVTLFLTVPEDYDGGELVVEDTYGTHRVKLPAGHMVLYPSTSLHHVTPVTRGARVSSFFWVQSMIRDDGQRTLLFDLDQTIGQIRRSLSDDDKSVLALAGIYHNLVRAWASP